MQEVRHEGGGLVGRWEMSVSDKDGDTHTRTQSEGE